MTEKTKTGGVKSWMSIFKGSKKRVNHDNDGDRIGVTKARSTSSLSEKDTAGSLPTSMTRSSTTTTTSSVANKNMDDDDDLTQPTTKNDNDHHTTTTIDCVNNDGPVDHDYSLQPPDKTETVSAALPSVEVFWQYGGEEVFVTGTFDDWSKSIRMEKQSDGRFMANIHPNDKTILYKFVVDGVWKHDGHQPTKKDKDGNINNAIQI